MKVQQEEKSKNNLFSKSDIILFIIIIALGIMAMIFIKHNGKSGHKVQISIDGQLVEQLSINEETTYKVDTEQGENIVIIENGQVQVSEADCPDKICVNHSPIKNVGEVIICLPHKLVVEVVQ